jgi:uroporphyrinogen III methyltransferase/synthase
MGAADLAARLRTVRLASIGPVTSATLRELGLPVAVEAGVFSAAGLAAALASDAAAGRP